MSIGKVAQAVSKAAGSSQGWDTTTGRAQEQVQAAYAAKFTLALEQDDHTKFTRLIVDERERTGLSSKRINMTSVIRAAVKLIVRDEDVRKKVFDEVRNTSV